MAPAHSNFFWDTLYVFDQTKVNKKDGATSPLAPLDLTLDRHQADRRLVILDRETFPRRRTSDQNNCSGREGSHQTNYVIRSIYKQILTKIAICDVSLNPRKSKSFWLFFLFTTVSF